MGVGCIAQRAPHPEPPLAPSLPGTPNQPLTTTAELKLELAKRDPDMATVGAEKTPEWPGYHAGSELILVLRSMNYAKPSRYYSACSFA